jgi:hypothetical protein
MKRKPFESEWAQSGGGCPRDVFKPRQKPAFTFALDPARVVNLRGVRPLISVFPRPSVIIFPI